MLTGQAKFQANFQKIVTWLSNFTFQHSQNINRAFIFNGTGLRIDRWFKTYITSNSKVINAFCALSVQTVIPVYAIFLVIAYNWIARENNTGMPFIDWNFQLIVIKQLLNLFQTFIEDFPNSCFQRTLQIVRQKHVSEVFESLPRYKENQSGAWYAEALKSDNIKRALVYSLIKVTGLRH